MTNKNRRIEKIKTEKGGAKGGRPRGCLEEETETSRAGREGARPPARPHPSNRSCFYLPDVRRSPLPAHNARGPDFVLNHLARAPFLFLYSHFLLRFLFGLQNSLLFPSSLFSFSFLYTLLSPLSPSHTMTIGLLTGQQRPILMSPRWTITNQVSLPTGSNSAPDRAARYIHAVQFLFIATLTLKDLFPPDEGR